MFPKDKAINELVFFILGTFLSARRPLSFEHEYSSYLALQRRHVLNQSTNIMHPLQAAVVSCKLVEQHWQWQALFSTI